MPINRSIPEAEYQRLTDVERKHERLLEHTKFLAGMHQDLLVVMQAAWIEWRHGKGPEAALGWIQNTLVGPGLIPDETAPYGKEAQAFFDANQADPMPQCFCGRPSNIGWMAQGFCSEAHYREGKAKADAPTAPAPAACHPSEGTAR